VAHVWIFRHGRRPGNNTTSYTYDNASNVATVAYPNGVTSTLAYDELNRLTELSTPPVADYKWTFGWTGNRTNATESTERTLNWTCAGIFRLTNEAIGNAPSGLARAPIAPISTPRPARSSPPFSSSIGRTGWARVA
jgi:YD repeat-containing protein